MGFEKQLMVLPLLKKYYASSMNKPTKAKKSTRRRAKAPTIFSDITARLFAPRLSLQEQALFARRLSLLAKSGVSLLESLNILKRQTKGATRAMFDQIAHDVAGGRFLSKSLARHKHVFGDFAINIIRVGETSGTLPENLKYLAEEIEKKKELRGKVIGALIYPAILMVAAFAISGILTLYLFPKLMPVFSSLRVNLPMSTIILIRVSTFLSAYGLWVIVGLLLAAIGVAISLRFENVRFLFHRAALRVPIMGSVFQHYHITNMCRTMGILLHGQVRVTEAVGIVSETSTNLVYKKELARLQTAITKGSNISKHLEKTPRLFPTMLAEMVAIGEMTGNLSETLMHCAEIYEHELAEKTKRLSSVIEPAMMLSMGLLVGFIAISIITPIYEVTQHLQPK
jgi:type IV pilus assembly protein PilC